MKPKWSLFLWNIAVFTINYSLLLFLIHASSCDLPLQRCLFSSQMRSQQLANNQLNSPSTKSNIFSHSRSHFSRIYVTIHSFQSRDRLEDLEGKTSWNCSASMSTFQPFPSHKYWITSQKTNQRDVGTNASFGHLPKYFNH